jgi:preprotein translocase subunit SecG
MVFLFVFKVVHYVVSGGLIILILFQTGKSRGMVGVFGGYGSDQVFSAPGKVIFVKKLIVVFACIFLINSLVLTKLSKKANWVSVVDSQFKNQIK